MTTRVQANDPLRGIERARRLARHAVAQMAVDDEWPIVRQPAAGIHGVEPMAGFRAAHELEVGARYTARNYLREAREAGATWHDIGMTMDPHVRLEAARAGRSPAELAYQYAVERDGQDGPYYDTAFSWTCQSCDKLVIDRGPFNSPAASQPGHADECARIAKAEADWDAGWEAIS